MLTNHITQMVISTLVLSVLLLGCVFGATLTDMSEPWQRRSAAWLLGAGTVVTGGYAVRMISSGVPVGSALVETMVPLGIAAVGALLLLRRIPDPEKTPTTLTPEDLPPIPPTTPGLRTGLGQWLSRLAGSVREQRRTHPTGPDPKPTPTPIDTGKG